MISMENHREGGQTFPHHRTFLVFSAVSKPQVFAHNRVNVAVIFLFTADLSFATSDQCYKDGERPHRNGKYTLQNDDMRTCFSLNLALILMRQTLFRTEPDIGIHRSENR